MSAARATGLLLALAGVCGLLAGLAPVAPDARAADAVAAERVEPRQKKPLNVLVFSRTTTFRHYSIPLGISMIRRLGEKHGFSVTATEDPAAFGRARLRPFDVVVFLNTTGTVLDHPRLKRNFRRWVERGGGYVGIHSAADTHHEWPWYERLVGAHFLAHPLQQLAWFENEAPNHPATSHMDRRFLAFDEFYSFKRNPRPRVRVLLTIDEGTYFPDPNTTWLPGGEPTTGVMGDDHPMAWCHDRLGGRSFYTALGHEGHMYLLDWFKQHVLAGILLAAREIRGSCRPRR